MLLGISISVLAFVLGGILGAYVRFKLMAKHPERYVPMDQIIAQVMQMSGQSRSIPQQRKLINEMKKKMQH